ncbi:hypothetical protein LTR37_011282 [Vermiconidia calcicola]|uniref:Uncharacterized protein n=1 Tax=Vermiconidia calcicola TaxID=1690605 RepID=A0ACC3N2D8_9PEZI|nr:hypothetical protein LTR37_011282 [Vermiconidia calcicola]
MSARLPAKCGAAFDGYTTKCAPHLRVHVRSLTFSFRLTLQKLWATAEHCAKLWFRAKVPGVYLEDLIKLVMACAKPDDGQRIAARDLCEQIQKYFGDGDGNGSMKPRSLAETSHSGVDTRSTLRALAEWIDRKDRPLLQPDTGSRFTDYNTGRWPSSPLEPALLAVLHQHPEYDFSGLDLITDRQPLNCLLELATKAIRPETRQNSSAPKMDSERSGDFSFFAQVVNKTVLLIRNVEDPLEVVKSFRGYRKDFNEHYLQYPDDFIDVDKHQRITTYSLGDLRVMLRHNTDGFISVETPELAEALHAAKHIKPTAYGSDALNVMSGGYSVPRSATLELNTYKTGGFWGRSQDERLATKLQESWLSQHHWYIEAPYREPRDWKFKQRPFQNRTLRFEEDPTLYDVEQKMLDWEEYNQDIIKLFYNTLAGLLRRIRSSALEDGRTFRVDHTAGVEGIEVMAWDKVPCVSEVLRAQMKMVKT